MLMIHESLHHLASSSFLYLSDNAIRSMKIQESMGFHAFMSAEERLLSLSLTEQPLLDSMSRTTIVFPPTSGHQDGFLDFSFTLTFMSVEVTFT